MKHYGIATPNYQVRSQSEYEPAEYGADYIEVVAKNKTAAKKMAKFVFSNFERGYVEYQRDNNECPFTGLVVEDMNYDSIDECIHNKQRT